MRHVLVVASRTAVAAELREALLARAERGPVEFTLLLPAPPAGEAALLLRSAVEGLRTAGLDVAGQLGDVDPGRAVAEIWDPDEYDEVIVSTLPPDRSQWLAVDVPRQIALWTGTEVELVVAGGV